MNQSLYASGRVELNAALLKMASKLTVLRHKMQRFSDSESPDGSSLLLQVWD